MISQLGLALVLSNIAENHAIWTAPEKMVLGHRGARAQAPENTIPAFSLAMDLGADGIEFDVFLTADKVPVVIHDDTLDRTTNGKGIVWEKTLAELRELDASKGWNDFKGTYVPTLAETLASMPNGSVVNIELKGPGNYSRAEFVDVILGVIKTERHRLCIIVSSFDSKLLKILRKRDADVLIGLLLGDGLADFQALANLRAVKPNALHISSSYTWPWIINLAHKKGLRVLVWTVNDKAEATKLQSLGVEGIFSDLPKDFL